MHRSGWEIGSHGVNHYNFTQLQTEILQQELSYSKQIIEDKINTPCLQFAYPWGRYSSFVKKAVKEAGYQFAVSARHAEISSHSDLLALPRINISRNYSLNDFKNIIIGKWDYLGILHKIKGL